LPGRSFHFLAIECSARPVTLPNAPGTRVVSHPGSAGVARPSRTRPAVRAGGAAAKSSLASPPPPV